MNWSDLVFPILYAATLLTVPGYLLAWGAKAAPFARLTLAPVLSVALLGTGAVLSQWAGIPWSLPAFALTSTATIAATTIASLAIRGRHRLDLHRLRTHEWLGLVGVALSFLILSWHLMSAFGFPDSISQSYDAIFHYNAVEYISESGRASSLTLYETTKGVGNGGLYPGGWHSLVFLVQASAGISIPASSNAVTFAVAGIAWPLSMLHLASATLPTGTTKYTRYTLLVVALLSAGTMAFPGLPLKWGILYPYFLSIAITPALLGMIAGTIRNATRAPLSKVAPRALGTCMAAAGVGLAHPSGVIAAVVFSIPFTIAHIVREYRSKGRERRPQNLAVLITALIASLSAWYLVRPGSAPWHPRNAEGHTLGDFLLNSFKNTDGLWMFSIAALLGVVAVCRKKARTEILGMWLLAWILWHAVTYSDVAWLRILLVGPWYADSFRIGALAAIPAVLLASVGVMELLRWVHRKSLQHERMSLAKFARSPIVVIALCAAIATSPTLHNSWQAIHREFQLTSNSLLIESDELAILNALPEIVPEDDTILVNPWEGGSLAYSLSDREVSERHVGQQPGELYRELYKNIDDASPGSPSCDLVHENSAYWYLDFNDPAGVGQPHQKQYAGLDRLPETEMVEIVEHAGDVQLYRIVGCGTKL